MRVHIATQPGTWKHLWCKVVRSVNLEKHCVQCLLGSTVRQVRPGMTDADIDVTVLPGEYLYVCGVAQGYRAKVPSTYAQNFHLAVALSDGALVAIAREDISVAIDGGTVFEIPKLPSGHNGRDERFTNCRNYQFAVAAFGSR